MKPDELWEKYRPYSGIMLKHDFLAALAEYGQAVRDRDAEIALSRVGTEPKNMIRTAILTTCAAAISREPMP